ncbi:unnamed protein product [Leptosia nina]|uniref:Chemosensory protein n=1 Tax=Leptosia nina TaxID=320188 RepID=A0AAV1JSP1_9NEOP
MKSFIILSALVALVVADSIEYYTTNDDHYDIDAMMKDPIKVKSFMDCFLDIGSCDSLAESYKKNMKDAVATACRRCNDPQKHLWNRALWGLKNLHPAYFEKFQKKYDPENLYIPALEKAVAGY